MTDRDDTPREPLHLPGPDPSNIEIEIEPEEAPITRKDIKEIVASVLAAKASAERDVEFEALPKKKQRRIKGTNKPVDPREHPGLARAGAVRTRMNAVAKGEPTGGFKALGMETEWGDTPSKLHKWLLWTPESVGRAKAIAAFILIALAGGWLTKSCNDITDAGVKIIEFFRPG